MVDKPLNYRFNSLTYDDEQIQRETLQNMYEVYMEMSGHDTMTLEQFKQMLMAILQTELDRWNRMSEVERNQYREKHHLWDKARYIDRTYFDTA